MLGSMTSGKKLDLSKLTDEEAKHVWDVIQRDFNLRKTEEDRLGDLKTKIEKEDTKRELLNETSLTETFCIRCLKPFQFLVNNKRQCLDCALSVCKNCSRYNKKEQGWLCDPCHMTRVLKIGTLEWYHENVRARFKRFGSAKVMRSLFKRLNGEPTGSDIELRGLNDSDTQSMPEVHTTGYEDGSMDHSDGHHYKEIKKPKRRLLVDPIELDLGFDFLSEPRGRFSQNHSPSESVNEAEKTPDFYNQGLDHSHEMEPVIIQQQEEFVFSEGRGPSRSVSRLSYSSCGSAGGPRTSSSLPGPEDSEEDEQFHTLPLYQSHLDVHTQHTSQESLTSSHPLQITDLNKKMAAVESVLNRMEHNMSSTSEQLPLQSPTPSSVSPVPEWKVELEEQQLRQKLSEMTNNISDHSDEDEDEEELPQDVPTWRSPLQGKAFSSKIPTWSSSRLSSAGANSEERTQPTGDNLEVKQSSEEDRSRFRGSTALLFELEDKVAQAAADVQNTESQVSFIENRIAALNSAGMTVQKRRTSAIPVQARRLSQNFPTKAGYDAGLMNRRLSAI